MPESQPASLYNLIGPRAGETDGSTVKRALEVIRSHLGMEVAYVSEFVDGRSVFREVNAPGLEALIKPGDSHSLDDVYCRHILEGRLPELIPDTAAEPLAASMPITKAANIGSHISVPIRMPGGQAYGMFCCVGFSANPSLNDRDLKMMRAFADVAAFEISREHELRKASEEKLARIRSVIEQECVSIVYQPIWSIEEHRPVGLECLSRFMTLPQRSPDVWFNEAAETGLGIDLENMAIRLALSIFRALPAEAYLTVNASPATILSPGFANAFDGYPLDRIVLEVTEHFHVDDYEELLGALKPLRLRGMRLAVDDAGAGYASLQHILYLNPDVIKLDMALTRHIDVDPARRALASALITFAHDTGSKIVAEGVETASELATLKALGVEMAQGYFLARPSPLESALKYFSGTGHATARIA